MASGAVEAAPRDRADRLSRDDRRAMLLDAAAALVLEQGAPALTVERLAERAGVSRALIYQHAQDRGDLLLQLYERERAVFEERARRSAPADGGTEALLRALHGAYLDAVEERGELFVRLVGEPSLAGRIEELRRRQQEGTVDFWSNHAVSLGVPEDAAYVFARCFASAALASGELMLSGVPRSQVEDVFYRLVVDTLRHLSTTPDVSGRGSRRRRAAPPR
jgi:AcrR family transcriptional regulator